MNEINVPGKKKLKASLKANDILDLLEYPLEEFIKSYPLKHYKYNLVNGKIQLENIWNPNKDKNSKPAN